MQSSHNKKKNNNNNNPRCTCGGGESARSYQLAASTMFAIVGRQRKRRAAPQQQQHPSEAGGGIATKMTSIGFNWSRHHQQQSVFLISFIVAIISAACGIQTGKYLIRNIKPPLCTWSGVERQGDGGGEHKIGTECLMEKCNCN